MDFCGENFRSLDFFRWTAYHDAEADAVAGHSFIVIYDAVK